MSASPEAPTETQRPVTRLRASRSSAGRITFWRRFARHRLAAGGAFVFVLLCLSAVAAGLSPYDPNRTSLLLRYEPPSLAHPFGTDDLGRDELTRVLLGGRLSLAVGIMAMLVSLLIGTTVGAIAGHYGGLVDSLLMRITEMFLAFPDRKSTRLNSSHT